MPKYEVLTEETAYRTYPYEIELPVDMGDSTERLSDRMVRTAAENNALIGALDGAQPDEKVIAVRRDGEQIWPRKRKVKVPATIKGQMAIPDYGKAVDAVDPIEEEA